MVNKLDEETKSLIAKLIALITPGLVAGLGNATPGGMCIEAAVSLATTGEFGDMPPCVAKPDRDYAIRINDAQWSSPQARAAALLPLAIAQIGTAGTDRTAWVARLAEGTIRRVVPLALRAAASAHSDATHREALEAAALRCETEGTIDAADAAAAASFAAYAVAACADAAHDAAHAAVYAASYAAADAARAAARVVANAASGIAGDDVLRISVQVALDAYAEEKVA